MIPKYKCFGCGRVWQSEEVVATCPVCQFRGTRIREGVDIAEIKWNEIIKVAERFIEKEKRKE